MAQGNLASRNVGTWRGVEDEEEDEEEEEEEDEAEDEAEARCTRLRARRDPATLLTLSPLPKLPPPR